MNEKLVDYPDLHARAMRAYVRSSDAPRDAYGWPYGLPLPSQYSEFIRHDGREYIVLRNVNGVLAVYRVRTNGALKRLKRYPAEVAE